MDSTLTCHYSKFKSKFKEMSISFDIQRLIIITHIMYHALTDCVWKKKLDVFNASLYRLARRKEATDETRPQGRRFHTVSCQK